MHHFSKIGPLEEELASLRSAGHTIGLVPTMGALHEGHLSLIKACRQKSSITVVSIFVNPLQFDREEDLINYPRDLQKDLELLDNESVDVVFTPSESEMYPQKPVISVNFGPISKVMEGKYREGHFEGVGLVVAKLFNIVKPDKAFFGLKDLQQYLLIKRMCLDLGFRIEMNGVETKREPSGLALSSRNQRLSAEGLTIASGLHQGLQLARKHIAEGSLTIKTVTEYVMNYYSSMDGLTIEYLEFIDPITLTPIETFYQKDELAICVAGYVEGIRLIDNLYLQLN